MATTNNYDNYNVTTSTPTASKDNTEFINSLSLEARQVISTLPESVSSHLRRYGETWVLNHDLVFDSPEFFFHTPFYSNNILYTQLSHYLKDDSNTLYFDTLLVKDGQSNWRKDEFRILSFTTKIEKKLATWLSANGVRL